MRKALLAFDPDTLEVLYFGRDNRELVAASEKHKGRAFRAPVQNARRVKLVADNEPTDPKLAKIDQANREAAAKELAQRKEMGLSHREFRALPASAKKKSAPAKKKVALSKA